MQLFDYSYIVIPFLLHIHILLHHVSKAFMGAGALGLDFDIFLMEWSMTYVVER